MLIIESTASLVVAPNVLPALVVPLGGLLALLLLGHGDVLLLVDSGWHSHCLIVGHGLVVGNSLLIGDGLVIGHGLVVGDGLVLSLVIGDGLLVSDGLVVGLVIGDGLVIGLVGRDIDGDFFLVLVMVLAMVLAMLLVMLLLLGSLDKGAGCYGGDEASKKEEGELHGVRIKENAWM